MNEPTITLVGNLTAEPEVRFSQTGKAVAGLHVACNPRPDDAGQGTWTDGTPNFWRCEVWGSLGENAADSLHKGDRVLITGRVKAYTWTPTDGLNAGTEQRRLQVVVDELGPSLRFVTTKQAKAGRGTGGPAVTEEPPF